MAFEIWPNSYFFAPAYPPRRTGRKVCTVSLCACLPQAFSSLREKKENICAKPAEGFLSLRA
jgi:hypothetical protein